MIQNIGQCLEQSICPTLANMSLTTSYGWAKKHSKLALGAAGAKLTCGWAQPPPKPITKFTKGDELRCVFDAIKPCHHEHLHEALCILNAIHERMEWAPFQGHPRLS